MITLQFVPHREFIGLDLADKVKKILNIVKQDKILLIDGKLGPEEESELIKKTMELIDKKFKGIEICTLDYNNKNISFGEMLKRNIANLLVKNYGGLTIVGPASVVKEIKKDPNKIELYTLNKRNKRKK